MSDQENIKRIQEREAEWADVYSKLAEGSDKSLLAPHLKIDRKFRSSLEIWEERFPDLMFLEPRQFFDPAIVGVVERINLTALCYDTQEVLDIVEKRVYGEGCSPEEALEHFEYNIRGSYVGEHSPVFLDRKVDL